MIDRWSPFSLPCANNPWHHVAITRTQVSNQTRPELTGGLPFLEIQLVRQARFTTLIEKFFATDRHWIPKGMVEVKL